MKLTSVTWGGLIGCALLLAGCGKTEKPAAKGEPFKVSLQTDWYAQAEHGGFYQAIATGLYQAGGLDVKINQGGPGAFGMQKVATGQTEFATGRSDDVLLAAGQGLPIVIVGAFMQHDAQALLLHANNPVRDFPQLDGKVVMAAPGLGWIRYLEARYKIKLNLVPLNYGLAQFMADPNFIQQCYVTNEPYFVRQNGIEPRTMLISDTGYDPYRVIFTSQRFLREHPDVVRAFVSASLKGWATFLDQDNSQAKALIRKANDKMEDGVMNFTVDALKSHRLVGGRAEAGEYLGLLTTARMQEQITTLVDLGLLEKPVQLDKVATFEFVPPAP